MADKSSAKYFAELFGTMVLVLIGCGSAVIAGASIGFFGISIAFGLALMAMVYVIGPISGCHINPAVTLAMWINKKISSTDAVKYICAQLIGAFIGTVLIIAIVSGLPGYDIALSGLGQNGFDIASPAGYSMIAGLIAEIVFTALFVLVIFGATSKNARPEFAGLVIGVTLAMIHIVAIPITGVSVNPARSVAPALGVALFGNMLPLSQLWLFIIAPIIGAVIAALIQKKLFESK